MDGIGSAEGCWGSIGVLGRIVRSDMGVRMSGWVDGAMLGGGVHREDVLSPQGPVLLSYSFHNFYR